MFKLLIGAAAGAAAAWFLDPNEGARRRGEARDKAFRYARQGKDEAARQASYAGSTIKGKAQAMTPSDRSPASERLNEPALQAKIESEVFRAPDAPKGSVSVNVENGIAYLRGELEDRSAIERIGEAVAKVEGVRGVESLLHTPDEPAPAKDESHSTAGTGA